MAYRPGTAFGNKEENPSNSGAEYLKGIGTNHQREFEKSTHGAQQRSKLSNLHDWKVEVKRPMTAATNPRDLVR